MYRNFTFNDNILVVLVYTGWKRLSKNSVMSFQAKMYNK